MKGWKDKFRYRLFYRMLHAVSPLVLKKYDFQTDKLKDFQGPYLVMSNHLTEVDMFILAAAFPKPMFFVAGEHLLRSKNGPFMKWAQDPIFEFKGSVALDTAREILDRLNSSEQFTLGEQAELIGVYYINKGYPDFRQITINYQNEEYAIVEPNSAYGLQEYDYIVLYADSIHMNDYY